MRKNIFFIGSLSVFATLNYIIWHMEEIKANGETVLLEIESAYPGAFNQGNNISLRYNIERGLKYYEEKDHGYVVISLDHNRVAKFVRFYGDFYGNESLAPGEKLLRYNNTPSRGFSIVPDSFMFQEGLAKRYEQAKYAIFRFDASGNYLLVGLADQQFRAIEADS